MRQVVLKLFTENWRKLTSDPNILDIVEHCHIELDTDPEILQSKSVFNTVFSEKEENIVNAEIEKLLHLNVLIEVSHTRVR